MENDTTSTVLKGITHVLFSWYDYVILIGMLTISGGLGIFFGCFKDKKTTAKDFLLGGSNMKVLPVAISLVAR